MTCNLDRNLDGHWLVLRYEEEVCMKSFIRYRMILYLVEYCVTASSVTELEVYDVRVWSMGDSLEVLSFYSEEDVLHSESIDVARNLSCSTYCLDSSLVASLTDLAVEFNVFHCCKRIKMCYSVFTRSENPIAPKSVLLFMGPQR